MNCPLTYTPLTKSAAAIAAVRMISVLCLVAGCASGKEQREAGLVPRTDGRCEDATGALDVCCADLAAGKRPSADGVEEVCRRGPGPPTPRRAAGIAPVPPNPRRTPADEPWAVPMPVVDDSWPGLGLAEHGSVSLGSVSSGNLFNGAELPLLGQHHVVLHDQSVRRTNFGSDELLELVKATAAAVADEHPGAIMTVGNLSRQGGGRIPWSISHRVGRDVDISFYLSGEDGEQVVLPNMLPLPAPAQSADYQGINLRFDVAKNWSLLHHVLTWDKAQVQYVFVADHLLDAMFELARSQGISARQIEAWREVVRQPRGTLPHDDHFHVRILCSDADMAEGCRDIFGGRERVPFGHHGFQQRTKQLLAIAGSGGQETDRVHALMRLGWMRAPGGTRLAYKLLQGDSPPQVERAALGLLEEVKAAPRLSTLVAFIKRTSDAPAIISALRLLRRTSRRYGRKLIPLLQEDRIVAHPEQFWSRRVDVLAGAVRLLGWVGDLAVGRKLVPFLEHGRLEVRRAALFALRTVAADEVFPDSILDSPPDDLAAQWRRFVRRHRDVEDNFRKTLATRGYAVKRRLGRKEANQLLAALLDVDWVSLNAQRTLGRITGRSVPFGLKDKPHVRWLWKKIVRRKWR